MLGNAFNLYGAFSRHLSNLLRRFFPDLPVCGVVLDAVGETRTRSAYPSLTSWVAPRAQILQCVHYNGSLLGIYWWFLASDVQHHLLTRWSSLANSPRVPAAAPQRPGTGRASWPAGGPSLHVPHPSPSKAAFFSDLHVRGVRLHAGGATRTRSAYPSLTSWVAPRAQILQCVHYNGSLLGIYWWFLASDVQHHLLTRWSSLANSPRVPAAAPQRPGTGRASWPAGGPSLHVPHPSPSKAAFFSDLHVRGVRLHAGGETRACPRCEVACRRGDAYAPGVRVIDLLGLRFGRT